MLVRMAKAGFRRRVLRFLRWWLLVGGLSAIAVGAGFAAYTGIFLLRSVATKGTIVRLEPVPDEENGGVNYAPVFSFRSEDGQIHTIQSGVASSPPGFDEGDVVRVLYVKSNPDSAKIDSFLQLWSVATICCGLGLLFGVPGYLLFRNEQKRKRRALAETSSETVLAR
jgi:hypothetical protein